MTQNQKHNLKKKKSKANCFFLRLIMTVLLLFSLLLFLFILFFCPLFAGYVFWCLFQALAPMIWFYPLNELEITGYEAFSVMTLFPVFLEFTAVINFLQTYHAMCMLRLLSVASLASFQAPNTLSRLIILTLGTTCALLVFTITLWSPDARIR